MLNDLNEAISALQYFDAVLSELSTTFDGMVVNDLNENLLPDMIAALSVMRQSLTKFENTLMKVKLKA
jgi:hypothetical protein